MLFHAFSLRVNISQLNSVKLFFGYFDKLNFIKLYYLRVSDSKYRSRISNTQCLTSAESYLIKLNLRANMDEDIELSEEEEEITADTVLKTLQSAWQNERLAPEILPHKNDMVECMLGQIQHMEHNINKLPKTDLRAQIHRMELNRIKFIICNYLKTRLNKIEQFCIPIVNEEKQRIESGTNYLTPSEYKYALDYLSNMESHLKTVVLDKMPANMQAFEMSKMAEYPNIQTHVFLKANENVNGVVLEDLTGDDEEIDLDEGTQHVLQYKPIADLVKNGKVQLV